MRFTYLLINFFTILVPLLYSAEPRIKFYRKWKYLLPGMIVTAIVFITWDYFMIQSNIWSFNKKYILGWKLLGLPLEEFLFFITVPYACTFMYENVSHFLNNKIVPGKEKLFLRWLSGIAVITALFFHNKIYTFTALLSFGLFFPVATLILSRRQVKFFLITYLLSLIPMALVNGLLTWLPVVIYNNTQNLGIRIGSIPVEDFFYSATLLAMNITLYEWAKSGENVAFDSLLSNLNHKQNVS